MAAGYWTNDVSSSGRLGASKSGVVDAAGFGLQSFLQKTHGKAFKGTFGGFTAFNAWFYALGVLIVLALQTADIIAAMAGIGFGVLALFFLLVDEPDDAFADAYSAAVSTQNIRPKTKQRPLIIAYVAISAVLAAFIPITQYETFLLLIGALFIPVFGVVLTDYYILKNRNQLPLDTHAFGVNPRAIGAWAAGSVTTSFPRSAQYSYLT